MKQCVPLLLSLLLGLSVVLSEAFTVTHRNINIMRSSPSVVPTLSIRGGGGGVNVNEAQATKIPGTPLFASTSLDEELSNANIALATFGSLWGTGGFLYILGKAIKRVLPIALEPFQKDTALILTPFQWG